MAKDRHPSASFASARMAGRLTLGGALIALVAVASCTTGSVLSLEPAVDVGSSTASITRVEQTVPSVETAAMVRPRQGTGLQTLVPSDPYLAGYPRIDPPVAPETNTLPSSEMDCRQQLKRLKVEYTDLAPIRDGQCGIDHPVKVASIGSVQMKPAATLTCAMALSVAQWTKNELTPSARRRYLSGVKTIHQGSSYSCRKIARSGGVLSEHGKGNALDIMRIELNSGRDIDVRKPGFFAFREKGLLNTVRADGCQYFSTVLGPGYNRDHRDHFHFDIKQRRNNRVACH